MLDGVSVKVSVVVPVYNPGSHIDGLIDSLRRQSMPPEDFEVVFVDDGSTDGTGERLDRLAVEAPNMRVIHIPNSGWPGKPRNVGIRAARGEYVQFVDNDDRLGEQALERLYSYARENDSDVVVGKEIRLNARAAFGPLFRVNRPRATLEEDPLLSLLTPHKMFRRAFLDEHDIHYFEGPRRLEDHPFVVKAFFRAKVISVLSDYTCYYWIQRKDRSNAGLRPREWFSYYGHLRDALDVVEEHTSPGERRNRLLAHWYRTKGLALLGAGLPRRADGDGAQLLEALHELAEERFPVGVDAHLPGIIRVRSALLRLCEFDRIRDLARLDQGMQLLQTLDPLEVDDGRLVIRPTANLAYPDGTPVALEPVGDRLYWRSPVDLGDRLPEDTLDFTDDFRASRLHVVARGRASNEAFVLSGEGDELPSLPDGIRMLGGAQSARLSPATLMSGNPISKDVWDLELQVVSCGWTVRKPLRSFSGAEPRTVAGPALARPRLVVPFTTVSGDLALDVDQHLLPLTHLAPPDILAARLKATSRGVRIRVPLSKLAIDAPAAVGRLRLKSDDRTTTSRPLRVAPGRGVAALVAKVPLGDTVRGSWRLLAATRRRETPLGLSLHVERSGRARLRGPDGQEIARIGEQPIGLKRLLAGTSGAVRAVRAARRFRRRVRRRMAEQPSDGRPRGAP